MPSDWMYWGVKPSISIEKEIAGRQETKIHDKDVIVAQHRKQLSGDCIYRVETSSFRYLSEYAIWNQPEACLFHDT